LASESGLEIAVFPFEKRKGGFWMGKH
jgi:hypothetical protein